MLLLLVLLGDYLPVKVTDGPLSNCKSKAKQFVLVANQFFVRWLRGGMAWGLS